jgi:hypothetical protein
MTSPEGRRDRAQPVRLVLRRRDAGTLLGALAWVLGALQIMRDRGHYEDDEEFHALYDDLAPRVEQIVGQLVEARQSSITRPEFEEEVEQAYADIRRAFEAWIQLTAADTLSAAVAARLDEALPDEGGESGDPES